MVELFTAHRKSHIRHWGAFGATDHKFSQSERRLSLPYTLKNYYFNENVVKTRSDLTT